MSIWFKPYTLEEIGTLTNKYLTRQLGIELQELGDDFLRARMPVDERTKMPFGLLHGGASCVLAESLASWAAFMCIDPQRQNMVGLEINANHLRGVSGGWVSGICRPIHRGRSTQVWDVRIEDEDNKLVCISRVTMAILDKSKTA